MNLGDSTELFGHAAQHGCGESSVGYHFYYYVVIVLTYMLLLEGVYIKNDGCWDRYGIDASTYPDQPNGCKV